MSRYFSKIIDRYFLQWIAPDTWVTYHPMDMERFYQFVKAIKRYSRTNYGPKLLKNIIKAAKKEHPEFSDDLINEMAEYFSGRVHQILDYESAPFPDPFVEMRDPYAVSLYLRRLRVSDRKGGFRPLHSQAEIDKILEKNFGTNWRERSFEQIYGKTKKV